MSKRARITLNPEVETEPTPARETAPLPAAEAHVHNGFDAAADSPSKSSAPANRSLSIGAIVKVLFAGLAVAGLLLLWNNRRL